MKPVDIAALAEFAKFVKTKAHQDLIKEELTLLRQLDLPMMSFLSMMPEKDMLRWLGGRELSFLEALEYGKGQEWAATRMASWEKDAIPGISKGALHPSDVILFHSAQRSALVRMVGRFTKDPNKKVAVLSALDTYFLEVMGKAMETYQRMAKASAKV